MLRFSQDKTQSTTTCFKLQVLNMLITYRGESFVYTPCQLLSLKSSPSTLPKDVKNLLYNLGINRSRWGVRAGKRSKLKKHKNCPISTRITLRTTDNASPRSQRTISKAVLSEIWYQKTYIIPLIISTNLRAITKKVDELQYVAEDNHADALCITESWLLISQILQLPFPAIIFFEMIALTQQVEESVYSWSTIFHAQD